MQLNPIFVSNIHDIYGQAGNTWLDKLPVLIQQLAEQWNFQFLKPVADTAILKIAFEHERLATEVSWLNAMQHGVPSLYNYDKNLNAVLMEHLIPGVSLKSLVISGKDDLATAIICETIRHLQSQESSASTFTHLSELMKSLAILENRYDATLLSQAKSWFHDLTVDRTQDVILHGDLHHGNILSSDSHWKSIDPHGYTGDPVAEVGAMIRNPFDCFPTEKSLSKTIERRLSIMADELPFDRQKIKQWAFCITVLSAAWTLENHKDAKETDLDIEVAAAIHNATRMK
jgi:streptomycin 6-kinase